MKRMFVLSGIVGMGIMALGLTGCEWTSGGGVETWVGTGYDWANFSGDYRAPDGRVLVREFGVTNNLGTISITNSSRDEVIGTGDGMTTEFSGTVHGVPIPGTLTILVGGYRFTDATANTGLGTFNLSVSPADGSSGTINYASRVWTLKFPAPIGAGAAIKANYMYLVTQEDAGQGNHGQAIYSFVVFHTGNTLRLVDSNGTVYDGYIGDMNTTAGNYDPTDAAQTIPDDARVFAQFSASGSSAGYMVTIAGTLQGDFSSENNAMVDRTMQATFVESGGYAADINAQAAD